jgi:hypothetical protein
MGSFAGVPSMMGRPPNQVLLVNVPTILHNSHSLREFLLPCGNTRSILFVPPIAGPNDNSKKTDASIPVTALLTLSHADAALRVVSGLKQLMKDDDTLPPNFQTHLVPTNPDIPLPPAMMDSESMQVLAEKLQQSLESVKKGETATTSTTTTTTNETTTDIAHVHQEITKTVNSNQDGDDEEEADPLKAPEVLKLVQEFRNKLEQQQGSKSIRRKELVCQRLEQMLPVVRQRMKGEAEQRRLLPPLPPAGGPGLPAPHPNLPPVPEAANASLPPPPPPGAPRGVSNLPAWMTAANSQPAETAEPPAKKARLDVDSFPNIPADSHAALRSFISSQIRNYLGEEEATLIDFIFNHVTAQKTVESLLPELKEVLDDDAAACLQAILAKSVELAEHQGQ